MPHPAAPTPGLTVFFPAYNDAPSIPGLVADAMEMLPGITDDYEVIVVNDGSQDNTGEVRVYQTDDAKLVSKLAVAQGGIYAVAFNPAGTQVASAGFDGIIRFSDAAHGQLIKEFPAVPLSPAVAAK